MAEPQEDSPAKGVLAPKTAPTEQPPPAYVPPKPATWKVIQPSEPWCPSELVDKLGFEVDYQNDYYVPRMFLSGPWSVTGATRRGRMHAHQGSFREDAMAFRTDSCFSLFCVCDGAGSSSYSRVGSELTARKYCKIVGDQLKKVESVLRGLSRDELHKQLRRMMLFSMVGADHYTESPSLSIPQLVQMMARALKVEPKEFRCTILTVLLYHHHDGDVFLFGNVGDGFMAALKKNGEAIRIGGSHSGSYSGEVVCFVPDPGVNSYYQSSIEKIAPLPAEEVEAVLICTDGVEDP